MEIRSALFVRLPTILDQSVPIRTGYIKAKMEASREKTMEAATENVDRVNVKRELRRPGLP